LEAGQEIEISVEYSQNAPPGSVQLVWSLPNSASISPQHLLDRVKKDGTTLILLKSAESWMNAIAQATGCVYKGFYPVGRNWIGGIYFVKEHPLFNGLPTNTAMGLTKHWCTREIRD
jgi:beta-galactosidase